MKVSGVMSRGNSLGGGLLDVEGEILLLEYLLGVGLLEYLLRAGLREYPLGVEVLESVLGLILLDRL